jgi:hypothetical protein
MRTPRGATRSTRVRELTRTRTCKTRPVRSRAYERAEPPHEIRF